MNGCWREVRKKNAMSPIAVPDIVPTPVALREAFQFVTQSCSDEISTVEYQIDQTTAVNVIFGLQTLHVTLQVRFVGAIRRL
jgi:hypothetical protein